MNQSLQWAIYKGLQGKWGAAQFTPSFPHVFCSECKSRNRVKEGFKHKDSCSSKDKELRERDGAVFLEMASTIDKNVYDWDNKVTFALSVTDIGSLLHGLVKNQEVSLTHDPNAKTEKMGAIKKYLKMTPHKDGVLNGVMLYITQTEGENKKSHSVPVSGQEVVILKNLLESILPKLLNW